METERKYEALYNFVFDMYKKYRKGESIKAELEDLLTRIDQIQIVVSEFGEER